MGLGVLASVPDPNCDGGHRCHSSQRNGKSQQETARPTGVWQASELIPPQRLSELVSKASRILRKLVA